MSSELIYNRIFDENIDKIKVGDIEKDPFLQNIRVDCRLGISLILSITNIRREYDNIIKKFEHLDPNQYYYPFDDLHVTVFDFIQASDHYERNEKLENEFKSISEKVIRAIEPFSIIFKGIVFSNAAGLIKGYDGTNLVKIRQNIRKCMSQVDLKNDERYFSKSSHITFCRFTHEISNINKYIELIRKYKEFEIGTERIVEMTLVEHDWYNTESKKKIIENYKLGKYG